MTNKLPEVGKRYKFHSPRNFYERIMIATCDKILKNEDKVILTFYSDDGSCEQHWSISDFFESFEEFPDYQEKPEVQLTGFDPALGGADKTR